MVDFKSKLVKMQEEKRGITESTKNIGSLKDRLAKKNNTGNAATSSLRNKFKKRDTNVLERTYDERNERSKASSVGKRLFNQELLAEFGIEDFATTLGDRFIEILPISFDPNVPYFKELSVHLGVGFANDAYLCLNRFKSNSIRHDGRCYRCERQQVMWRDQDTYTKDETKKLYPLDRACYLVWERTKELVDGESPDYTFKIWAAPKGKVHSEIQEKVRDKLHRVTLDISDISINGDGRTVSFTIVKQGEYPDYKAFDLIQRDNPIPEEVLEKLSKIIQASEERGFNNCIEMFLNIPAYEEIQESMATEDIEDVDTNEVPTPSKTKPSLKAKLANLGKNKKQEEAIPTNENAFNETALMEALEEQRLELEEIARNPIKWRKWCKDNDYEAALELADPLEAIPIIIDDMYEKEIAQQDGIL